MAEQSMMLECRRGGWDTRESELMMHRLMQDLCLSEQVRQRVTRSYMED